MIHFWAALEALNKAELAELINFCSGRRLDRVYIHTYVHILAYSELSCTIFASLHNFSRHWEHSRYMYVCMYLYVCTYVLYIIYVWGYNLTCMYGSRLPASASEFPMPFKLSSPPPHSEKDPDNYLPIARTCFFTLSLPKYSSVQVSYVCMECNCF